MNAFRPKLHSLPKALLIGALVCFAGTGVVAKDLGQSRFLAEADTNGDGLLSQNEFVLFQGEREMKRRDRNKDEKLSKEEWVGSIKSDGFYGSSFTRFNKNDDDVLSVDEIVDVFLWTFGKPDKDKNGALSSDEAPKNVLR